MSITPYSRDDVKKWAGLTVFQRASGYERQIKELAVVKQVDAYMLSALVHGGGFRPYQTGVTWDGKRLGGWCSCPYGATCKHMVAVALAAMKQVAELSGGEGTRWRQEIEAYTRAPALVEVAPTGRFVFRLHAVERDDKSGVRLLLAVGAGEGARFKAGSLYAVHARKGISPVDRLIAKGLEPYLGYGYYEPGWENWQEIRDTAVDEVLTLLAAASRIEDIEGRAIALHPDCPVTLTLAYERTAEGALLRPVVEGIASEEAKEAPKLVGRVRPWLWLQDGLHPLSGTPEALSAAQRPIVIPEGDRPEFEHRYLPDLAIAGRLVVPGLPDKPRIKKGKPVPQLVLEEGNGALHGRLGFLYAGIRVEADDRTVHVGPPEGPWFARSAAGERKWIDQMPAALTTDAWGRSERQSDFMLMGEAAITFLFDRVPELVEAGVEVIGEDRLTSLQVHRGKATSSFSVSSGVDWLDLEGDIRVGDETVPWPEVWAAIASKRRFVRLGSGRLARLPADWLESQRPLLEALGMGKQGGTEGHVRVQRYQAPLVDRLLSGADRSRGDAAWKSFLHKLKSFGGIEETPLPAGFTGELRAYQRQGLNFLTFLRDYGLHGILADDMGLGKTVQAAALLAANHAASGGPPSLVVAPTSVIHNWKAELARFAPGLKTLVLHGPGRDVGAIAGHDVVITTYATVRLDLKAHLERTYHTLLLDEAQAIKNPKSQTAEVVKALQARHRLCLTGTPIENNLMELWSQFAFLMPGMLSTESDFKSRYAGPIAWGDRRAAVELKARIAPFILRRLKSQVAKDLPPRTDVPVWCELSPAQRRLYDTVLKASRARVMAAVAEKGVNQSQITILDALLKLRQVCCHPALLGTPETMHLPSAKVDAFLALVDELVESGHRALVFSQFTSMLAILRERLDGKRIAYEYLDGATQNRQERVDRFNRSRVPLFLISLKAGGTGLNLTGADYVIHFDPWWNPAVEDQATDRAHRIGQTRHVFNYKLLAKDTVEEKLLALQERKRALVRDVLDADTLGKKLTLDDLAFLFGESPVKPTPSGAKAGPRAALAERMRTSGTVRSADYQAAFGVDGKRASLALGKLVEAGVLVKEGDRRATCYRPGSGWAAWADSQAAV